MTWPRPRLGSGASEGRRWPRPHPVPPCLPSGTPRTHPARDPRGGAPLRPELLLFPCSGKPALLRASSPPAAGGVVLDRKPTPHLRAAGAHPSSCPWPRGLPPPALLTSLKALSLGDAAQHPAGAAGRVFPAPVGRPGLWSQRGSCWEARPRLIIAAPSLVLTSQAEGKKARASTRTEVAGPDWWGRLPPEERKPWCGGNTCTLNLERPESARNPQ